jgi:CarD family transcriptional regulator
MEKIKTGSIYELAQVLRDLTVLKGDKELSFGERKMLDTARSLLLKEISIVKELSEVDAEQEILELLK